MLEPARIAVRSIGRVQMIDVEALDWLVGAGNYVEMRAGDQTVLHRETLASLADRLDPTQFVRIHRSVIVRRANVRELRAVGHGRLEVVCADRTFRIGRKYRAAVAALVA